MKASNLQALYAERVQLIGFHHQQSLTDSTAMGVANARILHRNILSSNSNNNNNNNNNNNQNNSNQNDSNNNNNNSISNKTRAKRCLFGTPDPGEMQTLFADSMEETRKEFLERFSYDIMTGQPVIQQDMPQSHSQCSVDLDSACLVNCNGRELIELELSEEDRMRFTGECRLQEGNLQSDNESCSDNETCNHQDKLSCCCATSTNAAAATTTNTQSSPSGKDKRTNDRFKPYTKQTQITDYFPTRKTAASVKATHDQPLIKDDESPQHEDGGDGGDKV